MSPTPSPKNSNNVLLLALYINPVNPIVHFLAIGFKRILERILKRILAKQCTPNYAFPSKYIEITYNDVCLRPVTYGFSQFVIKY